MCKNGQDDETIEYIMNLGNENDMRPKAIAKRLI
jgi:hypothetical protein